MISDLGFYYFSTMIDDHYELSKSFNSVMSLVMTFYDSDNAGEKRDRVTDV